MATTYKTNLGGSSANFEHMMENGFGIVTVMNADIYPAESIEEYSKQTAYQIVKKHKASPEVGRLCRLDTLKIANVTEEGPSKTITGGQYSNPLVKFGKSARLEMQDALGHSKAIEALCGGTQEWNKSGALTGLHFGEDFVGPKLIIGDSFFIDRVTGQQVKVKIVFYQFLPDSIFNLTQDAEGDATVFDMNGDLLTTEILIGNKDGSDTFAHGEFYSIINPDEEDPSENPVLREFATDGDVNVAARELAIGQEIKVGGQKKTISAITLGKTPKENKVTAA